jgi:hypothetical protein
MLNLMKYKDEKTSSTINTLLNMIYAIRIRLDDFVTSPNLEGNSELNKKIYQ